MNKVPFAVRCLCAGILVLGLVGIAQADPVDLALGGTATQSSTYPQSFADFGAAKAIDGSTDGNIYNGSVTHTLLDNQPWWQVDLRSTYALSSIVLWNRTDSVPERLSNFSVSVLDAQQNSVWSNNFFTTSGYPNPSFTIDLPSNTSGEFVKVQLSRTDYLSLAEVQVYGTTATAVPEPATLLFLGIGLIGSLGLSRKSQEEG